MRVLVFDPNKEKRGALCALLESMDYKTLGVSSAKEAFQELCDAEAVHEHFQVAIFPFNSDGLDIAEKWRSEEGQLVHSSIYIIFSVDETPDELEESAPKNLRAIPFSGGDDFFFWPASDAELEARLMASEKVAKLKEQVSFDHLTELPNRRMIEAALKRELVRSERDSECIAVVLIDIDDFKGINDTHGHPAGDMVLIEVGKRLNRSIRPYDYVGRYGGEEFIVILVDCDPEETMRRAEELRYAIGGYPITDKGLSIEVTASLGVAVALGQEPWDKVIKSADTALYRAKTNGKNRVEM